ncbi:MAG TPA: GPP34 family phosphoprotein [Clostridiales bacterium]|nr:GPP34 family phosphoprotein [Clostridiales bacterium]
MKLLLHEKLLLISIDKEKGMAVGGGTFLSYALAGALLAELLFQNRIAIENKMVVVKDSSPTNNILYDEVLAELSRSAKNRTLYYWIPKLVKATRPLLKKVGDSLQDKGLVRREDTRLLRIFPVTKFYVVQPDVWQRLVSEMTEELVLVREPDWEMNMLISLLHSCGFLLRHFKRDERREVARRARAMVKENIIAKTVERVIAAIQAATS